MVWFVVGWILGTILGFFVAALAVAAKKGDLQGRMIHHTECDMYDSCDECPHYRGERDDR